MAENHRVQFSLFCCFNSVLLPDNKRAMFRQHDIVLFSSFCEAGVGQLLEGLRLLMPQMIELLHYAGIYRWVVIHYISVIHI